MILFKTTAVKTSNPTNIGSVQHSDKKLLARIFPTRDTMVTHADVISVHQPTYHHIACKTFKILSLILKSFTDHLNCRKLDSSAQTAGDIAKLYWDARFLMG
jgi:hypothetical protein